MAGHAVIPWHTTVVVFAATCILIGILWDISWHSTIGRDTFWTPAHMMIYLGGSLGGLCCGWRVIQNTFWGKPEVRAGTIGVWGFRGQLGEWVTIWGSLAMLVSAPFDNWWHDAYGLDTKIISPPHSLLAAGMHHVVLGALFMVLSLQNRAPETRRVGTGILFLYAAGVMLALDAIILTEYSFPNLQHTATYYRASAILYPLLLVAVARASRLKWPATTMAAVYMLIMGAMTWVLPLFSATPRLAPIFNPVDHMVPPAFPHWLIVPGLAIDLLMRWFGRGRGWGRDAVLTVAIAVTFVGLFLLVQWNFSRFLLASPAADNWFFAGNRYWSYAATAGAWQHEFWDTAQNPVTWRSVAVAVGVAWFTTALGLAWGAWMARVKR